MIIVLKISHPFYNRNAYAHTYNNIGGICVRSKQSQLIVVFPTNNVNKKLLRKVFVLQGKKEEAQKKVSFNFFLFSLLVEFISLSVF